MMHEHLAIAFLSECAAGLIVLAVAVAWLISKLRPRSSDHIDWETGE